jgi:hypothetical protein
MSEAAPAPRSLAVLLDGLIDYAGLFPPASLDMRSAVRNYAAYRRSPEAFALGRFILPASRLVEFEEAVNALDPEVAAARPWALSALASVPGDEDFAAIERFSQRRHRPAGWDAELSSVEIRVGTPVDIGEAATRLPADRYELYFEVPLGRETSLLLDAIRATGRAAKIRTGGTVPTAFPAPITVTAFLMSCAERKLPYKATAGLHHPIRATHPVTSEPLAPKVTMHGFVNVFMAAAFVHAGYSSLALMTAILGDQTSRSFAFDEEGASFRGQPVSLGEIVSARRQARSFGSCSFEEPVADLRRLGWIASPGAPEQKAYRAR